MNRTSWKKAGHSWRKLVWNTEAGIDLAKIQKIGEIEGKSAAEIFDASPEAFKAAGFEVWKVRPMAWLSMAKRKVDDHWVNANLTARPTKPPSFTLLVSSDGLDEDALQDFANVIVDFLRKALRT